MVVESQGLQTKAKGSSLSVLFNDLFPNADSIDIPYLSIISKAVWLTVQSSHGETHYYQMEE
jgi:hypothetical protein